MRNYIKKIIYPFLKLGFNFYNSKPQKYCYENICIKVHPDVFPPKFTFSTKILLDFIKPIDLNNKTFLELGCGSGIISLYASKKGAIVTASDVNKTAIDYLEQNAKTNNLKTVTILSDLFESIEENYFDFIIVNPPYYPRKPKNIKEKAWFCGENFEYFEKLFSQLTKVKFDNFYMILSEDCEIETIKKIAFKNEFEFNLVFQKNSAIENNFIFHIKKTTN